MVWFGFPFSCNFVAFGISWWRFKRIKAIRAACLTALTTIFFFEVEIERIRIDNRFYLSLNLFYLSFVYRLRLLPLWLQNVLILIFLYNSKFLGNVVLFHFSDATTLSKIIQKLMIDCNFTFVLSGSISLNIVSSDLFRQCIELFDVHWFTLLMLTLGMIGLMTTEICLIGKLIESFNHNYLIGWCSWVDVQLLTVFFWMIFLPFS